MGVICSSQGALRNYLKSARAKVECGWILKLVSRTSSDSVGDIVNTIVDDMLGGMVMSIQVQVHTVLSEQRLKPEIQQAGKEKEINKAVRGEFQVRKARLHQNTMEIAHTFG